MQKNNIIYYLSLILLISTARSDFVLDSFLDLSQEEFNMDLQIILKMHFNYELKHKKGKLPEILNELLDFNTELIKNQFNKFKDSQEKYIAAVQKEILKIFINHESSLLNEEDLDVKLNNNGGEIKNKLRNLFAETYSFEFISKGKNVVGISDEEIKQAVTKTFSSLQNMELFNEEEDILKAVLECRDESYKSKSTKVVHNSTIRPISVYFNDVDHIKNNAEQVIMEWMDKTFDFLINNFRGKEKELNEKFMVLFKTLVFRDERNINSNGVDRACEFVKKMYLSELSLAENYEPLLKMVFNFLVTKKSLVERETILELIMTKVFPEGYTKNKILTKIIDYEYNLFNLESYFNNDTDNQNTASLMRIATFNLLRNISSKRLIEVNDFVLIVNNFHFLTKVDANRVLLVDQFNQLYDYQKREITEHPFIYNAIYNSVMNFAADSEFIFDNKPLSIQYNNYLSSRVECSVPNESPLSDDVREYGSFLQLWNLFHNLRDFSQRGEEDIVQLLTGTPLEDPLVLLNSRYEDLLNYLVALTNNNGEEFTLRFANGLTLNREAIVEMFKITNKRII